MFRISFFVEDKHLAEVLRILANKTSVPEVTPVPNAAMVNGAVKAKAGSAVELIHNRLIKTKSTTVRASDIKAVSEKVGLNPVSYQHFVKGMVKAGLLKRNGKGTSTYYDVVTS
jgi:hypothetical protein